MATNSLKDFFSKGYKACLAKNGIDPIPNCLPSTDEHRSFMMGWNKGLEEIKSENKRKDL